MAFSHYKSVTIASAQCGAADSTNFPVTIWITDADLKTIANGGKVQSASGYDIRPYSDLALTIPLTFELVPGTYSPTTGALEMHVLITTLSHTVDGVFYLAFGDATLVTDGSSTATWNTGFVDVWHLPTVAGGAGTVLDSTSTANHGTPTNTPTDVAGQLDGAGAFALASSQYVQNGSTTISSGAVTVSAWAKRPWTTGVYAGIFGQGYTGTAGIGLLPSSASTINDWTTKDLLFFGNGAAPPRAPRAIGIPPTLTTNTWHHIVGVLSASVAQIYVDGVALAMRVATVGAVPSVTATSRVGSSGATFSDFFDGSIDEVRVSNVVRSADWILAEYNNQKTSSTFLTWGALTPVSAVRQLAALGVG